MAITLHDKYAKQIAAMFAEKSFVTGRLSDDYDWSGAKTVKVVTPLTVPMNDYTRTGTNRYGEPVEMQDIVQEMTLTQDKSFALTIDKGNNADQSGLKAAGKMLALQIAERAVPTMDAYVLDRLANLAGRIVGNDEALTTANICERISEGTLALDDGEVPQEGRTLFVSNATYKLLKHSDEFLAIDELGQAALAKGQVGQYDNMAVVKVPLGRWPKHVNFMLAYKNSATAPVKLNDTRLHQDPPGISGNLLEGRQYYDCFVFGARCEGVYVEVDTSEGKGTVLAAPTISAAGAITGDSGASFRYTTDGTDPRYSPTAKTGAQSDVTATGTLVRAYAYKDGAYPSALAEKGL